jgi:hypothetical protein
MTVSSHSPTDIPARRAAARAVSRARGRTPFISHGNPDFIPRIQAIKEKQEPERGGELLIAGEERRGPVPSVPSFCLWE